jgi:mitogen-activated protein kinase organizer 1
MFKCVKTDNKKSIVLGTVNCVKFNEESTVILSGSVDGTVRTWDCRNRKMEPIQIIV